MKRIYVFFLGISFSLFANSALDLAENEACGDDGLCIVFSVMVEVNSAGGQQTENTQFGKIYLEGNVNYYKSAVLKKGNRCEKHVRVPKPIYLSIVKLMKGLSSDSATPAPAFTPAQQTMMLFYTTVMKQTLQFGCSKNDLTNNVADPIVVGDN